MPDNQADHILTKLTFNYLCVLMIIATIMINFRSNSNNVPVERATGVNDGKSPSTQKLPCELAGSTAWGGSPMKTITFASHTLKLYCAAKLLWQSKFLTQLTAHPCNVVFLANGTGWMCGSSLANRDMGRPPRRRRNPLRLTGKNFDWRVDESNFFSTAATHKKCDGGFDLSSLIYVCITRTRCD